ncbi:MAG TPA: transposase [Candidatus Cloacimonas acidaminovorans]|jgi:hypothetical protein|nr:transposase [Candidatus Cloacimonas acidaminovorans]
MKPQYRLLLVSLALIVFFVFFCLIYLENIPVQLVVLGVVLLLSAWTFKLKGLLKKLYHFLPFILLLFGVYFIFAFFQIGQNKDYWIHYGITRTTLLISSLMFIQVLITWLKIDTFLDFPLGIEKLKYIILGKMLYKIAFSSYSELCLFVDSIPAEQAGKITLKKKFRKRLIVLLALITYVINEATLKGEMIDERIWHCHQVPK